MVNRVLSKVFEMTAQMNLLACESVSTDELFRIIENGHGDKEKKKIYQIIQATDNDGAG